MRSRKYGEMAFLSIILRIVVKGGGRKKGEKKGGGKGIPCTTSHISFLVSVDDRIFGEIILIALVRWRKKGGREGRGARAQKSFYPPMCSWRWRSFTTISSRKGKKKKEKEGGLAAFFSSRLAFSKGSALRHRAGKEKKKKKEKGRYSQFADAFEKRAKKKHRLYRSCTSVKKERKKGRGERDGAPSSYSNLADGIVRRREGKGEEKGRRERVGEQTSYSEGQSVKKE